MRVITGTARGMRLATLEGSATRPTSEKVKEGMFSAIQFEIDGRTALDLFAGSGQLGIEALSRGAHRCDFVDSSPAAARIIAANLNKCRLQDKGAVLQKSWDSFVASCKTKYSLIFLDPPYKQGLCLKALTALHERGCLAAHTIALCETGTDETLPEEIGPLRLSKTYRYGSTFVWVYRTAAQVEGEEA
ncbi:MAG: 16S rRNA (guanine(966)-N(2))-methyltransferase RsmD [Clostridia bacterium]|nr:16S rRNA (guanine(966)-N(2))-methyltransferase RsmD [Clostridia bacterium]